MRSSSWSLAGVLLICGTLVISCSQAPPEPAPEFTLPLSQVTTSPRARLNPPRLHQRQASSGISRCHPGSMLPAWRTRASL